MLNFFFNNFWLHWACTALGRLSRVVAVEATHCSISCCRAQAPGHEGFSKQCSASVAAVLSLGTCSAQPQYLQCSASVAVAHRPSWSTACGIFPDQGSNLCPLQWQVDSYPPHHQKCTS